LFVLVLQKMHVREILIHHRLLIIRVQVIHVISIREWGVLARVLGRRLVRRREVCEHPLLGLHVCLLVVGR